MTDRWRLRLAVVALAVSAGVAGVALRLALQPDRPAPPSTRVGRPVPEVSAPPLGDHPRLTTAALRRPGVKIVNFWASWCVPCRAEHSTLVRIARSMDVAVYGINLDDDAGKALDFLRALGNPFRAEARMTLPRARAEWGVGGVPETLVIDGRGMIMHRHAGPITQRILQGTILPMIEAAREEAAAGR